MDTVNDPANAALPKENISSIVPSLYLGNYEAATTEAILRKHNIRYVVSVISNREAIPPELRHSGIIYKHFVKNDMPGEDMLTSFGEAVEYLTKAIQANETVLVHCQMGISRSSTMVSDIWACRVMLLTINSPLRCWSI